MKIAIIGGGAAGLFCAGLLKEDIQVDLFEKNTNFGRKLLLTGGGRCNVTNLKSPQEFLQNVMIGEKFLISAINAFSPTDMIELLRNKKIKTIEENDGKIFPASQKASTILNFLTNSLKQNINLKRNITIKDIKKQDDKFYLFFDDKQSEYDMVIIATGGKSYPGTGSNGDGYAFAKKLGHNVLPPRQSLCGLEVEDDVLKSCMGTSFNAELSILSVDGKTVCKDFGDVLLTHFGFSGPAVHRLSAKFKKQQFKEEFFKIDFAPDISKQELLNEINEFTIQNPKQEIFNFVKKYFAKKLAFALKDKYYNLLTTKGCILNKQKRVEILNLIKEYKTPIKQFDIYERAIVTRGGVDTKQINPSNMQSKINKNIFFLGEVLNVDALTGGYNLQIAFSTAYVCAKYINNL